ncbi:DUF3576 domain-containing protein [Pararhodobacter aggregans]|uniref:DUF3576 domain-containing protein n=2 Tax=Pararhodobacter TaxID=1097465 RepID=A0A2T7UQD0_9RHOB|nr:MULTISPECIES: DUF3576 domain-containing protein [Pararhodobacter]PTX01574.1 uncharacterized protein DUF3576 [Pararhodobacter aggregans]PVE46839.1 DUF3576 domain-containing protein [Pararhodobacter aggregans]
MVETRVTRRSLLALGMAGALAGCGGGGLFGGDNSGDRAAAERESLRQRQTETGTTDSIWNLFSNREDPSTVLTVNRYIWTAALETLDFLPVEQVDPFSGVITTGFGTPPGGGRPYRATIAVTDAALDARSLNVALMTRNGPASAETVRAVENAILTRARQIRIRELGL